VACAAGFLMSIDQSPMLNQARADAFVDRMLDMLNSSGLILMISIGHRTGLFDTMSELPPASSEDIASAAGLNERYVREWLGALTAGRIVNYDPALGVYHLPAEHAAFLTRAARPDNLAVEAQFIPLLAQVEDEIVECFKHGGGVHYCMFPRFQTVMAEESDQTTVAGLEDFILPLDPAITARLEAGIDVMDVGCGSGRAIARLAELFPRSRFTGVDLSKEGVANGKRMAEERGLTNLTFETGDAAKLNMESRFDLITAFDAIHDQADPAKVLRGVAAALRPGGLFLMQDISASSHVEKNIDHPLGAFLYTISCMHCMTVSLAREGAGLGAVWGVELATRMLEEAGFNHVRVEKLPHDVVNCYYLASR